MRQILSSALLLNLARIKQCGTALQCSLDEYSVAYWNKELAVAKFQRVKMQKRLSVRHNVITIDFQAKKRVA